MRDLVQSLCAPECAGRAPGTAGGAAARALILQALRGAGLDPFEQAVPGSPWPELLENAFQFRCQ